MAFSAAETSKQIVNFSDTEYSSWTADLEDGILTVRNLSGGTSRYPEGKVSIAIEDLDNVLNFLAVIQGYLNTPVEGLPL